LGEETTTTGSEGDRGKVKTRQKNKDSRANKKGTKKSLQIGGEPVSQEKKCTGKQGVEGRSRNTGDGNTVGKEEGEPTNF